MKKKVGLHELYAGDARRADRLLWGRETDPVTRRGFLRGSGLAAMGAVLGGTIPFAEHFPGGLIPAALAQSDDGFALPGKDGLCHISELSDEYVASVADVCQVGDQMHVKVIAVDEQDRVKLSRRSAMQELQQAGAPGNGDGA